VMTRITGVCYVVSDLCNNAVSISLSDYAITPNSVKILFNSTFHVRLGLPVRISH
jgi:hypothetical protein